MSQRTRNLLITGIVITGFLVLWWLTPRESSFKQAAFYQQTVSPGDLSAAHSHLQNNCAACHTAVKGVDEARCIACHANNETLLQRQPTAFHANVSSCRQCHLEHQGYSRNPTSMDHESLAKIGLAQLSSNRDDDSRIAFRKELLAWSKKTTLPHSRISSTEILLDCSSCHSNDDRHFQLFGRDCASCHSTDRWVIPEFLHPSGNSRDCAQCHQAPPSHYMMHFKMISQRVAGKHNARVDQCFECHQTTSWNDIKNAGWYKHH